jgi:hypothetical protein
LRLKGRPLGRQMRVTCVVAALLVAIGGGCDWFEEQPQSNLPPTTEFVDCPSGRAVNEGDDITFVWTGFDVDGTVIGYRWSYDGDPWAATADNSVTIEDVAPGEHSLRVVAVDDDHASDPDTAECTFSVLATGTPVDRSVLVELFTDIDCRNCPQAEEALRNLLADFGHDQLSVVAYHGSLGEDPLATEETAARIEWYEDDPGFPFDPPGFPTAAFDGLRFVQGARTTPIAEADYRYEIETRMETGSPISIRTTGDIRSDGGSVAATIKVESNLPQGRLAVRFALVESDVYQPGPWASEFAFVARDLLADGQLDLGGLGDSTTVERQFTIDGSWNSQNMDVIVFVQDLNTQEVIQSGRLVSD